MFPSTNRSPTQSKSKILARVALIGYLVNTNKLKTRFITFVHKYINTSNNSKTLKFSKQHRQYSTQGPSNINV